MQTCMPHKRTPSEADVLAAHFAICLLRFSADASSPCCLVPIFKSNIHGCVNREVIFSSNKKSIYELLRKKCSLCSLFTIIDNIILLQSTY